MDKFKVTFRMVLLVLTILSATSVHSQIRSDEKTGCYTDNTLHFHWYLPASLKWQFQPGMESHTVFRAEAKCGITAIVNVRPIDGLEGELSQEKMSLFFDVNFQRKLTELALERGYQVSGVKGKVIEMTKCKFGGTDAIKSLTFHQMKDDVNDFKYYTQSYRLIRYGSTWQVSLKVPSDVWKLLGASGRKEIFQGFGFNCNGNTKQQK